VPDNGDDKCADGERVEDRPRAMSTVVSRAALTPTPTATSTLGAQQANPIPGEGNTPRNGARTWSEGTPWFARQVRVCLDGQHGFEQIRSLHPEDVAKSDLYGQVRNRFARKTESSARLSQ